MPRYVVAPDSFKGCLSSSLVADAIAEGIVSARPGSEIITMPLSDGGEGMLTAVASALDAAEVTCPSYDPLMRRIDAPYAITGDTAVIESATVCGMQLLTPDELSPLVATTYGLGIVVADAIKRGSRHIIVGLGGTATSDAGIGMLRAIGETFSHDGHFDATVRTRLDGIRFTILSDVTNPLLGDNGAARVFAPQKGAAPSDVEHLEWRSAKFAAMSAKHFGYDRSAAPSSGAAGGLGYAFLQYLDAEVRSGADYIMSLYKYKEKVSGADAVFTGEGRADCQTLMGKLPYVVLQQSSPVPVHLICGTATDRQSLLDAGFATVTAATPADLPRAQQLDPATACANIAAAVRTLLERK